MKLPALFKETKIPWSLFFLKLTSGRFLLTIAGAICFCMIVSTMCELIIEKKDIIKVSDILPILSTIILVVSNIFTFYFTKTALRTENGNGK